MKAMGIENEHGVWDKENLGETHDQEQVYDDGKHMSKWVSNLISQREV